MDDELLYQEFLSNGGNASIEEFISMKSMMVPADGDAVKKKDDTQPTERSLLTAESATPTNRSNQDVPLMPNPIPENEFLVPLGNEQDLPSWESATTAPTLSMELPSTDVGSSGTEGSNQPITENLNPALNNLGNSNIVQQPTFKKAEIGASRVAPNIQPEKKGMFTFGETNEDAVDILGGKNNDIQGDITPTPSTPQELAADALKRNQEAERELQNENKKSADFLNQYVNKDYASKLNEFDPEKPKWIDNVVGNSGDNYVNQILEREKRGEVKVARNDNGQPIDKDSKPITDNSTILWQPTGKYVDEYNAEIRNYNYQVGEKNIDAARFNQGNTGNEPELDSFGEFMSSASKFGVIPTTEEYESLTSDEARNEYLATAEAAQKAKNNKTTFQEEYDKVSGKYKLSDEVKIANGFDAVNLLNKGIENGEEKDKAELDYFTNFFSDKNNVMDFGEFWEREGKAKHKSSLVRENQANYQDVRAGIWNDYLNYKNDKLAVNQKFIEEAVVQSSARADQYAVEGNAVALDQEKAKMENLDSQYEANESEMIGLSNLFSESNKNFSQVAKKKKEQSDFQLRVEKGDFLDKAANIAGQIPLAIGTAVNNTIGGGVRMLNSVLRSDNLDDAADIIGQTEIRIGNVKVDSRINQRIKYLKDQTTGQNYEERNGVLYGRNTKGELYKPEIQPDLDNLKVEREETKLNAAGAVFGVSKTMADLALTRGAGKGLSYSSRLLNNSKNIANVFGVESQFAKIASSYANIVKSQKAETVAYWFTQTFNDNYLAAESAGIKSENGKYIYSVMMSGMIAGTSVISPDQNFLKVLNGESRNIVAALLQGNLKKGALQATNLLKKLGVDVTNELKEEVPQQLLQDAGNIIANNLSGADFKLSTKDDYKDVVDGTILTVGAISLFGSGASLRNRNQATVNNEVIDLSTTPRNELVTRLALDARGLDYIKEYKDSAIYPSLKKAAEQIENEITTRRKYILKVPEVDRYTPASLSELTPLLQQIDKKKADLNNDDGTFAERINKDIAELTIQANAILDNDLKPNTENAETTQPISQQEAVQSETAAGNRQSEQTAATESNNPESSLTINPETNGPTTAEIQSPTSQAEENVQPSVEEGGNTADQLPEMGESNQESQQVAQEAAPEEEITEEEQNRRNIEALQNILSQHENPLESITPIQETDATEEKIPTTNPNLSVRKITSPTTGTSSFEFIDEKTGQVRKVDEKTERKHLTEIVKNTTYPETAVPEGIENENDYNKVILSESKNPKEIAAVLMTMPKYQDVQGTKDWHIANNMSRVSRQSFIDNSDENNITIGLAKAYFADKGKETNEMKIDVIAKTASDAYNGGQDGNDAITPEDVVNFMLNHRAGKEAFYRQKNPDHISAVNRFVEITGMNPSPKVLKDVLGINSQATDVELKTKADAERQYEALSPDEQNNAANEYNEWFNSLTLPEQIAELQNTYPYENISGNQEREVQNQPQPANTEGQSRADAANKSVASQSEGEKIKLQNSNQKFSPISQFAFDNLIERLKKPFAKAFSNLNVTTDWNVFAAKATALGLPKTSIQKLQVTLQDFRDGHTAPSMDDSTVEDALENSSGFNLAEVARGQHNQPSDYFDEKVGARYYGYGDFPGMQSATAIRNVIRALKAGKNSKDLTIKIYRSVPNNVNENSLIQYDWVSPSRKYAENHGESRFGEGEYKIIEQEVPIAHVWWDGNDIREWGYDPSNDIRFMKTATGEIYGAKLPDGTIYINPNKLNANTPIHEFSHLWEQIMPNAWKKGLGIFRETTTGKKLYNQLKEDGNYSNLTDDQVWSEAMNTHIGNIGEQQYQRKPKGKMAEFIDWFKTTMSKFWNTVTGKNDLNKELNLSAFTDKVLGDLLGEKVLTPESERSTNGPIQFMKFMNRADLKVKMKSLWKRATTENQGTEKIVLGPITDEAKKLLADLSGLDFDNIQNININQSNLRHIFKDHYEGNEKDKGNNTPLNNSDIENLPEILSSPTHIIYGKERGVNVFFFVKETEDGSYVSVQVYSGKNKNLNVRTMYKSKKASNQRADEIFSSLSTARTRSGASLSDTKILNISDNQQIDFVKDDVKNVLFAEGKVKPEFLKEMEADKKSIIEKAKADGSYLKAPNGKDTKLNEDQWSNVRTVRFKDWFGDWENDAENASKIIDENGEPAIVYHGTDKDFEAFEAGYAEGWGFGIYFTDNKQQAIDEFGNKYKSVFLNIRNNVNGNNLPYNEIATSKEFNALVKKKWDQLQDFEKDDWDYSFDKYKETGFTISDLLNMDSDADSEATDVITAGIRELGYDGIIAENSNNINGKEIVVFNGIQIKSATENVGTYSADNNRIDFNIVNENKNIPPKTAEALVADDKVVFVNDKPRNRFIAFKEKWFANEGGILKPVMNLQDKATGKTNMEIRFAKDIINKLSREARKANFYTAADWNNFDTALRGENGTVEAYNSLPDSIKPFVNEMRQKIDGLSEFLIENDLVTASQAVTIDENKGQYISRAYEFFESKDSVGKIFRRIFARGNISKEFDEAKWNEAVTVYQQNVLNSIATDSSGKYNEWSDAEKQSFARKEGQRLLEAYIIELSQDFNQAKSTKGANIDILKERKDVPSAIRKLLGEYTDPRVSYAVTIAKMSQMAYQRKFLQQVKEIGLGTLFFEEGDPKIPGTHTVKIASDSNQAYSPLNGLYTTPEFKDVFLDISEPQASDWINLWIKATGAVKYGKTILSPMTQAVNFTANFGFLTMNGLYDVRGFAAGAKIFADEIRQVKKTDPFIQELIEENVIGQNVQLNEIENDFHKNIEKNLINDIRRSPLTKDVLGYTVMLPQKLYKASDDFFKAYAYFQETNDYAKSMFGKPYKELVGEERSEVRALASEVVKNTLANYDRKYKAADVVRKGTRNLFGNFLSFQAESIRTLINATQIGLRDIKDPRTRSVGIRRLSGVMAYNIAYAGITSYFGKLAGIGLTGLLSAFNDDDEEEKNSKINKIVAPWARSTEKYYKLNDDGTMTYYTYGNINPYGITYRVMNAYKNGTDNTNEGGVLAMAGELTEPFVSTEMSVKWLLNISAGRNDYGKELVGQEDYIDYTLGKLSPTFVKLFKDNVDGNKNNDFEMVNMIGIKKYNVDLTDQLNFRFADYQKQVNAIGKEIYGLQYKVADGKMSPEEAETKHIELIGKQKRITDDFIPVMEAHISFGANIKDKGGILDKGSKTYINTFNSAKEWMPYLLAPEEARKKIEKDLDK